MISDIDLTTKAGEDRWKAGGSNAGALVAPQNHTDARMTMALMPSCYGLARICKASSRARKPGGACDGRDTRPACCCSMFAAPAAGRVSAAVVSLQVTHGNFTVYMREPVPAEWPTCSIASAPCSRPVRSMMRSFTTIFYLVNSFGLSRYLMLKDVGFGSITCWAYVRRQG